MKALRSIVAVCVFSVVSFGAASAQGDGKACCKDKSAANKSGDKCNMSNKTAKVKKTDAEKTVETAKKS